jgi:SEC-C motif domain protein
VCCAPLLQGRVVATTALALMRSRYVAYVRGAIDYLGDTHDPSTRGAFERGAVERWSRETRWLGLEIVATVRGELGDSEGVVEFVARGVTRGAPFAQRERSRFRARDGRWYYLDGVIGSPSTRGAPTQGRNELCGCGSGKKFKRCHGAA